MTLTCIRGIHWSSLVQQALHCLWHLTAPDTLCRQTCRRGSNSWANSLFCVYGKLHLGRAQRRVQQ
jgi:hypothetical protein